jgi:hypothetical protein
MNAARKKKPVGRFHYTPKYQPYNTGKVLIGSNYFPKTNYVCPVGERVQAALLGVESDFSRRRVRNFVLYIAVSMVMYIVVAAVAN